MRILTSLTWCSLVSLSFSGYIAAQEDPDCCDPNPPVRYGTTSTSGDTGLYDVFSAYTLFGRVDVQRRIHATGLVESAGGDAVAPFFTDEPRVAKRWSPALAQQVVVPAELVMQEG